MGPKPTIQERRFAEHDGGGWETFTTVDTGLIRARVPAVSSPETGRYCADPGD